MRERGCGILSVSVGVCLLVALLAMISTDPVTGAPSRIRIRFRQSFLPSEQYIPEVLALNRGYFAQQELDVEILRGSGGASTASLVAAGNDDMGIAGAADVLIARSKDLDVIGVGVNIPQDPTALISLSASPIRSISDIRGKRVGIIAGSTSFALLQALLKEHKIDAQREVNAVVLGGGDLVPALLAGRVDAIAAFETTNVPALQAAGGSPVSLRFADLRLRVPGNVYIVNAKFAQANAGAVARFLLATARGYEAMQREGFDVGIVELVKFYPELERQRQLLSTRLRFELAAGYLLFSPSGGVTLDSFKFDWEGLRRLKEALVAVGVTQPQVDIRAAFTDDYVDAAKRAPR